MPDAPPTPDDNALREAADGFFLAAEHGRSDVIKALADHSEGRIDFARIIDPTTGRSPLHVAVANRKTDALRVLLAEGFPPHTESFSTPPSSVNGNNSGSSTIKRTAYAMAVEAKAHDLVFVFHQFAIQQVAMDNVQGVEHLLASGVAVDVTDGAAHGNTLLHWAVTCRAIKVATLLVASEAAKAVHLVDQTNTEGATPLHLACRDGQIEFVRVLLDHGANPRCTGTGGFCKDKSPLDLVTSTEIRTIMATREERLLAETSRAEATTMATTSASGKSSEERGAGTTMDHGDTTVDDELAAMRRKHALQMEEKDLLIRQLKTTIESLVVEAQEIRKLGEERTVLDYVRKLREEKEIVRRQLEDAEDHIRIQQQQIQELKREIRQLHVPQQEFVDSKTITATGAAAAPTELPVASASVPPLAVPEDLRQVVHETLDDGSLSVPPIPPPNIDTSTDAPRSQQRSQVPTPSGSQSGAWGDVWNVLWGNELQVDSVEVDGEVIMTV